MFDPSTKPSEKVEEASEKQRAESRKPGVERRKRKNSPPAAAVFKRASVQA